MNIFQKLNKARIALQSTKLNKSGNNKFAGYSYFELGDFLPTINALFDDIGLCAVTVFGKEEASLVIYNCDKPEETITFRSPMADANLKGCHPIQNLGAVQTYQRRYLYMAALEIVEHEAIDSAKPVTVMDKFVAKANEKGVTPTAGAFDNFTEEETKFLTELAQAVSEAALNDVSEAVALLDKKHLEAEEKVAVWSLLDSKVRSAIKKEKSKPTAIDMIAQA